MKATQEKPKPMFMPITIIIETKDEADELWARLNVPESFVNDANGDWHRSKCTIIMPMFTALDDIYNPHRGG